MVDSTIGNLTAVGGGGVAATDLFVVVQPGAGGTDRKATGTQVAQLQRNLMQSGTLVSPPYEVATGTIYHGDVDKVVTNSTNGLAATVGIASGAVVDGGTWNSTAAWAVQVHTGTNAVLRNATVTVAANANDIGVQIAESNTIDTLIVNNIIQTNGFCVLTNNGPGVNIDGIVIAANILESTTADPVEINAPGVTHQNIAITGNVASAPTGTAGGAAGFAFGIAAGKCVSVTGNAVKTAAYQALHSEDETECVAFVGNVGHQLKGAGTNHVAAISGLGEGIVVAGNSLKAAASSTSAGVQLVNDGHFLKGCTFTGNRVKNFARGIDVAADDTIATGNVIEGSARAIQVTGGANLYGTNFAHSCTTLVYAINSSHVEAIVSDTTPTTILDVSTQVANDLGTFIEKFAFPLAGLNVAAGANVYTLFALPSIMHGRLIVTMTDGAQNSSIYHSADVLWDGATLTVSNAVSSTNNNLSIVASPALTASGGNIRITVQGAAQRLGNLLLPYVLFTGEYYKHN